MTMYHHLESLYWLPHLLYSHYESSQTELAAVNRPLEAPESTNELENLKTGPPCFCFDVA
jgi:hypothetical protein